MTLTIALLSWNSHTTLINTLDSYGYHGLDKLADQKVIFFQEIGEKDRAIADIYGYDAIGSPNNIGIGAAYKQLVDFTTSDLFLFLENDWLLIEKPLTTIQQSSLWLSKAPVTFILNNADVVRLRHRRNPGEPLWTRQFMGNEESRPEHLLDSIHWTNPDKFDHVYHAYDNWYCTDAKHANWTNNPTMFRTEWLRQNIVPRLTGDIEKAIQPWWATQTFKVVQGDGLFTHMRLDR